MLVKNKNFFKYLINLNLIYYYFLKILISKMDSQKEYNIFIVKFVANKLVNKLI